ncbi:3-dehydroquinate synthase [Novipirellula artificiosorum]|uniref:3-dehydroquinate synthase n=1 Tax=Novipirellula artificiosorum TaxID=2528016 RepID=A0A5C6DYJ7_9BACT|nr:3-dehydroquinate synthase [Novipirellula artificiosorum]TWU40481.1 3-dehydroquinate synthase [Novipirellula artificiosorum]
MNEEPTIAHDIPFSVPFVHRLRVTGDVAGADFPVLTGVLDRDVAGPSRVLVVAEHALREPGVDGGSDPVAAIASKLAETQSVDLTQPPLLVHGGEAVKNSQATVDAILRAIHDNQLDRRSYVVAIGGGAMLDAVGYAAAIAHRGVRLVRIPTTTLAQADSGVGVKNAINFFGKKNWIGTFAVPWAVINDWKLLETLPDRDFLSGFSEAIKVALLKDRQQLDWLVKHAASIVARDGQVARPAIHRSCLLHLKHITEGGDPYEMLEARPLDFGHWSAHRLESLSQFEIRHGEAVAIGVAIDCIYSVEQFGLPRADALKVISGLHDLGLKVWHPLLQSANQVLEGLEEFRQHLGGRLTLTMLRRIGDPIHVHEIDLDVMKRSIESLDSPLRP